MKLLQKAFFKNAPLLRAVGVLSAIAIIVSGVTFAALQSQQATLTGNTISSASADLRIGTSASTFSTVPTHSGFSFQAVIPGAAAVPVDGNIFYLKDAGTAPLALKVAVGTTPTNASNVDFEKVFIELTRVDTGAVQTLSLKSLIDANGVNGLPLTDHINPNAIIQYKLRASMAVDAFTGSGATIGGIDLVFYGSATTPAVAVI